MEEIVKNEFQFYSRLAKPLVLNLPKSRDRILAAAWIKKFRDENSGDERLRTVYLKLLLFCLQRRKLSGIFSDDPSNYEVLEELPPDIDLNEFARNLLEQEKIERRQVIRLEMMGDMAVFPPYTTDCSPDLTEYVAAQDIPNFGVHAFYAISRQPINKWQRSEKAILPKGTKSSIDTSITVAAEGETCPCSPKGTASAPEVEEADVAECKKRDKTQEKKKRRPKKFGTTPPTHPIGEVKHTTEERPTPTWGTNLVEIRERTDIGHVEEPSDEVKALDEQVSKLIEEQEAEEAEDKEPDTGETIASKAKDMLKVIEEYKKGKMEKPKKPPSRLTKLGDKKGIKAPKSIKEPKIPVKGMKKGKGKDGYGPKPANLPEEFADWTEKDLKEAGLTWADLMPIGDIDDELQQIEDEVMAGEDEPFEFEELHFEFNPELDLDAMLREAEEDLAAHKSVYDEGVEEDEPIVELFDDEIEDIREEANLSRTVEEVREASPALSSGIPVTTPTRSASPKRFKSPEKVFAEEDDYLLTERASPLRPPKEKKKEPEITRPKKKSKKAREPTNKDLNISEVFKDVKKVVGPESLLEYDYDYDAQFGEISGGFSSCSPCPSIKRRSGSMSPGHRSAQELDEFEQLEQQFNVETGGTPARGRSPCPGRRGGSPGGQIDQIRHPQYDEFVEQYGGMGGNLGRESPSVLRGSSAPSTEGEEFEMLEGMYNQQSQRGADPGAYNYDEIGALGPPSPGLLDNTQAPFAGAGARSGAGAGARPPMSRSMREADLMMEMAMRRAQAPESFLRQGSPQASEIIHTVEDSLSEELLQNMGENTLGGGMLLEETPPADLGSPAKASPSPNRPPPNTVISPTTGAVLPIPDWVEEDDDLGILEELVEGPFTPPKSVGEEVMDYVTDIVERCGGAERPCRRPPSPTDVMPSPFRYESPVRTPPRQIRRIPTPPPSPGPCPGAAPPPPFVPGVSSPLTPRPQRPIPRPRGYMSPHPPTPPPMYGPQGRPEGYMSPPATPYGPMERPELYFTPQDIQYPYMFQHDGDMVDLDDEELELADVSDEPCTPCGQRDVPPAGSLSPTVETTPGIFRRAGRRRPPAPEERPIQESPSRSGVPMRPRKLFDDAQEPCEPCGPPQPPPCGPCGYGEPQEGRRRRHRSKDKRKRSRDRTPEDDFELLEKQFEMEVLQAPCARPILPDVPPSPGEAARVMERARQQEAMLRSPPKPEEDDESLRMKQQFEKEQAALRRKVVTPPPPRQPSPVWSTPEGVPGPSRRPTGQTPPVYDSDYSPPPTPVRRTPIGPPAKRIKKRGRYPPQPTAPEAEIPFEGEQIFDVPCPGAQATTPHGPCGPAADSYERGRQQQELLMQSTPRGYQTPSGGRRPVAELEHHQPQGRQRITEGTPMVPRGRRSRRLFGDGDEEEMGAVEPMAGPCMRRSPDQAAQQAWSTPDRIAGPSRGAPRIPQERSQYIPSSQSPRTPTDEREMPSPYEQSAHRVPRGGGMLTPVDGRGAPLIPRRLFEEPGRTPRLPAADSPMPSPCSPLCVGDDPNFVPEYDRYLLENVTPPEDMPPPVRTLQDGQMYYPGELLPSGTPERLPTMAEIRQHTVVPDPFHADISHRTPFGRGPGPARHRESVHAVDQMERIPEYDSDSEWQRDILFNRDLDAYTKYYHKPPSSYPDVRREPRHFTFPPKQFRSPEQLGDLNISGNEGAFREVLEANLRVPPERYPPPVLGICPGARVPTGATADRFTFENIYQRYDDFSKAFEEGRWREHEAETHMRDIADKADLMFDYEGGLFDTSPPPGDIYSNYYPDVTAANQALIESVQAYDLPMSPPTPPPSIPSGSPRTPPPRIAPPSRPGPGRGPPRGLPVFRGRGEPATRPRGQPGLTRPGGPSRLGAPGRAPAPSKPATADGSCGPSAPCSADVAKKPSQKRVGPTALRETKSSQLRREKLAKEQQAEKEAQMKKERAAKAAADKKKKAQDKKRAAAEAKRREEAEAREARARDAREMPGPQFMEELQGHQIDFPGYNPMIVVKGRGKKLRRKSHRSFGQMEYISEEEDSSCDPCGAAGPDTSYAAALRSLGLTEDPNVGRLGDIDWLEEMEEIGEEDRSREEAIQALENQLREMDEYDRQHGDLWRQMAADFDDDELRELGITRAELQQPPCAPCSKRAPAAPLPGEPRQLTQDQQRLMDQLQQIQQRVDNLDEPQARSPVLTEFDRIEQAVIQREQEEREYFERLKRGEIQEQPITEEDELAEFERLEPDMAAEGGPCGVCSGGGAPTRPSPRTPTQPGRITYSPPRPQPTFGTAPWQQAGRHLPVSRTPSPRPPSPPSPPRMPLESEYITMEEPPIFEDMEVEDRPYAAFQWAPPARIPTPPPLPLSPTQFRGEIAERAMPGFDPGRRRDLGREQRRTMRAPCGIGGVQEEEPLIPCLAGAAPEVEGQRARRERKIRREPEPRRGRPAQDDHVSRYLSELEQRFDLPPAPTPPRPEMYDILDESIPGDLPSPMGPYRPPLYQPLSPLKQVPDYDRSWAPEHIYPFSPPQHQQFYVPPEDMPIHPDLMNIAFHPPDVQDFEGMEQLGDMQPSEDLFYTPPRYPETDEMELAREAMLLRLATPPSIGRGPCGANSPCSTPSLGLLDSDMLDRLDEGFLMTPSGGIGGQDLAEPPGTYSPTLDEFERLERETAAEYERRSRKQPRAEREFRERVRKMKIADMEENLERMLAMSPTEREFVQLEDQIMQESRGEKVSKGRKRRQKAEEILRRTRMGELEEEAERMEQEFRRLPSPAVGRVRTPPLRPVTESGAVGTCAPCHPPDQTRRPPSARGAPPTQAGPSSSQRVAEARRAYQKTGLRPPSRIRAPSGGAVQTQMPRQPPQMQTADQFARGGPRVGGGSRQGIPLPGSRQQQRPARQGAGCGGGGGGPCGRRPGPSGIQRPPPPVRRQEIPRAGQARGGGAVPAQQEGPRRLVRKTSSIKKIVTKQN